VRGGRLVTFVKAGSVDSAFAEVTWPQGQTGTFNCARGGNANIRIEPTSTADNEGPCELVVTTDGGVDGAVQATYRGYITTGPVDSSVIGTVSADPVRLGDDHLSGFIDGTFEVGTIGYDVDSTDVTTVLSGTVNTPLGDGAISVSVPRDAAPTCGADGNVVVTVFTDGLTLTSRGASPTSVCSVEVFAADGLETALTYTGQVCSGNVCGTVTTLSVYALSPQIPAEIATASVNGGPVTTATVGTNIAGSFLPSGNPNFIPDQVSILFNVDDASSEFVMSLTMRANAPMLPGSYPCSTATSGNRVSEAQIIRFNQRFTSTTCGVTVDSFSVINEVRVISGSFAIENATLAGSPATHAAEGTFTVHL
jgi:hypothetical protein